MMRHCAIFVLSLTMKSWRRKSQVRPNFPNTSQPKATWKVYYASKWSCSRQVRKSISGPQKKSIIPAKLVRNCESCMEGENNFAPTYITTLCRFVILGRTKRAQARETRFVRSARSERAFALPPARRLKSSLCLARVLALVSAHAFSPISRDFPTRVAPKKKLSRSNRYRR